MTAPAQTVPSLGELLSLVDQSSATFTAEEDQLVAESDHLYAQRVASYIAERGSSSGEQSEEDTHPFVNATLLAAMVLLLRRAFSNGSSEGLRFGAAQLAAAGLPFDPTKAAVPNDFIDSVVQDFLAGQVDVASKAADQAVQSLAAVLALRARTGVLVAYHGGRSSATEAVLAQAVGHWSGAVHKMWVARFDLETPPCPLCVRLHGTHVSLDDSFSIPDGEPAPYRGKLDRPPRHPRCRCSLVMYLPTLMKSDDGATPLTMVQYADQVLSMAGLPSNDFVSATMVYIKPYARVVNGKTQMVDGYYYDVQSGMKIPAGSFKGPQPKKVSLNTAKSLTEQSQAATTKAKAQQTLPHAWLPGTYIVDVPHDPEWPGEIHVVVHDDGSSTTVFGDTEEDADPKKTGEYLYYWAQQGALTAPSGHGLDDKQPEKTLPPGHHLLPDKPAFGGVEVHPDGSGDLHNHDFTKSTKLSPASVKELAQGKFGKIVPAGPEDFVSDWHKKQASASSADEVPDEIAVADHPSDGHGKALSQQTLFTVGTHQVAIDEGAQVYRSSSSKDTLYVLGHDGTVTKYNPQGQGVQATVVASSENPSARSALLSKLDNVSDIGIPVKNSHAVPGTKQVYLGGLDLTSTQLEDAISALNDSPSSAIASTLLKAGSPLGATDVHAIAAPYKAMFNNKTKPAFLHALGLAHQKSGHTSLVNTGGVSHLEQHHGMKDHHASLGNSDIASIHDALHSLDPEADHDHADAGPGLIDVGGATFPPELVSAAIKALQDEKSTSVKGPLKKAQSPLAGAPLNDFTNSYAGTKLHYSKFKPTLIKALQESLDKHQKSAPPHEAPSVSAPEPQVNFHGVHGTKAQLLEARNYLDTIDFSAMKGDWEGDLKAKIAAGPGDNPFLHNLDWADVADSGHPDGISLLPSMNEDIHNAITKAIGGDVPAKADKAVAEVAKAVEAKKAAPVPESPQVSVGGVSGSALELQSLLAKIEAYNADGLTIDDYVESGESPFTQMDLTKFAKEKLGTKYVPAYALADLSAMLQSELDNVGVPYVTEVTDKATIGNKAFDKNDLLKAVDLLKAEASTSVKGPLKADLPELAKVDLKALAEEHAGTKLHYSKLKPAVIAALQAKADQLVDPLPSGSPAPESVVTKVAEPVAKPEPTALEKVATKATPAVDNSGTWNHPGSGITLIVNPDGSGHAFGLDGAKWEYNKEVVDGIVGSSTWTKVSDNHVDPPPPPPVPIPESTGVKLTPPKVHSLGIGNLDKPKLYALSQDWAAEAGYAGIAGLHLKNQKKNVIEDWIHAWANGEWDKAYEIELGGLKNHKAEWKHPGSPFNPDNAGGFTKKKMAPAVDGEIPAGEKVPGSWPDTFSPYGWSNDQVDNYMIAAQMQNPTGLTTYGKKAWVVAHAAGNKVNTDTMSAMAQTNTSQGLQYSDPILPDVEKYLPGQVVPVPDSWPAFDPSKSAASQLTNMQTDQYISHLASKSGVKFLSSQPLETKQQLVQLHYVSALPSNTDSFKSPAEAKKQLSEFLTKLESDVQFQTTQDTVAQLAEVLSVKDHHYTLDPVQPFFGGGSGASMVQVTDETGKTFIFKAAGSPYRADTEHGMHELAKLSGIAAADSRLGTWDGQFGQFQAKLDSKSSLTGVPAYSLPTSVLSDIAKSHVFDWAINNDDAHSENFLLSPDGQHAYSIDFGRGYARFGVGWMNLQLGNLSGQADLYYNRVYDDIISGKISDSDADKLYQAAVSQARKMEAIPDASWRSVLENAFERRTKYNTTSASNKAELIAQALDRKNSLVSDFEKFWDSIYAKAGRAKPELKTSLGQHVFSGNSDDWHARAATVGAGGAATFFAGTDLEDSHLLAQVVKKAKAASVPQAVMVKGIKAGHYADNTDPSIEFTINPDGTASGNALQYLGDVDDVVDLIKKNPGDWSYKGGAGPLVGDGSSEFWLSGQLRQESDAKLHKWMMDHLDSSVKVGSETPEDKTTKFLHSVGIPEVTTQLASWAKTISHHHKQGDKNYNSLAQAEFAKAQAKLQQLSDDIKSGNYPSNLPDADVANYETMIQHYLNQAAAIDKLQMTGGVSHKGDFPPFDFKLSDPPIKPEVKSPAKIKVVMKKAFLEAGSHDEQGNLVSTGVQEQQGQGTVLVATLPDGTEIEYRSWNTSMGVPLAQKGMLKVKVRNYDGTTSSAEPALAALRDMGLDLSDSTDEDMELFYWRHLYGVLQSRADTGSYTKTVNAVKKNINPKPDGSSSLSKTAELEAWRDAWSHVDAAAVKSFVAKRGYMPRFSHPNVTKPQEVGGQPYWMRFDVDLDQLRKTDKMPVRTVSASGAMAKVIRSGGSYSTEDRMKLLGKWSSGMSSSSDQSEGSSNFVFTRIDLSGSGYQYYFRPEALARTTNYSYSSDRYGRLSDRKGHAYFDFSKATSYTASGNETMIKHTLTLLDDMELVAFQGIQERQEAINFLHAHGIYSIRGLPVTSRLVLTKDIYSALKKINAHRKTWDPSHEEGDPYGTT